MIELKLDPNDARRTPRRASGIGNLAARATLATCTTTARTSTASCGTGAYSDYTNYRPVNTAEKLVDQRRFQPPIGADGKPRNFGAGPLAAREAVRARVRRGSAPRGRADTLGKRR